VGLIFCQLTKNGNSLKNHHYQRIFKFPDFVCALKFVNQASEICEQIDHHAEFVLSWGQVVVKTWSHDIDGISDRDLQLCNSIDKLFKEV
jgi:4a-hydroxytetrahydrobiopterin dehydratase